MPEPVVAIVAETRAIAADALEFVTVEYDPLSVVADPLEALKPGAPLLHDDVGANRFRRNEFTSGDVDGALASADLVISQTFRTGRHTGVPMEPRGCVASLDMAPRASAKLEPAAPGAIANAVNDALRPLGVEVHVQPMTPEVILAAIQKRHRHDTREEQS